MRRREDFLPARREPMRAFPFRTFDEIAALGMAVRLYCPGCYRRVSIDLADERLRGRSVMGTRFVCSNVRQMWSAQPPKVCNTIAEILIDPPADQRISPSQAILNCSIACPRCRPRWEVSQAAPSLPPWDKVFDSWHDKVSCPTCRAELILRWTGFQGIPASDGWDRPTR